MVHMCTQDICDLSDGLLENIYMKSVKCHINMWVFMSSQTVYIIYEFI